MAIQTATGRMIGLPKTAVKNNGQEVILGGTGVSTVTKRTLIPPTPTSTQPAPGLTTPTSPSVPTGSTTPGISTTPSNTPVQTQTKIITTPTTPTTIPGASRVEGQQPQATFDTNGVDRSAIDSVNSSSLGDGYERVPLPGEQVADTTKINTVTTSNKSRDDLNKDGILNADELSPEMKAAYNMMTPAEQKGFEDAGKAVLNDQTQQTKALANYVQQRREQKDYMTQQNEITNEQAQIKANIERIQSSQRITDAQNKLDTLKRTTAYLGSGGQPGVSQQSLDQASKQITQAEATFQQLQDIEAQMRRYTELGMKFDSSSFANQMDNLQDQLDNQVDKSIQKVFNQLSDPQLAESIDTIEGMNALRDKLYSEMDMNIKGYTDVANAQREFLLRQYDEVVKEKKEYIKQKNTVNMDMSTAQGFYVNGLGEPILNAQGGTIVIPEKPPLPPQLDLESGKLISYKLGKDGEIVASVQQILPPSESKALDLEKKRLEIAALKNPKPDKTSYTFEKNDDGTYTRKGSDGSLSKVDDTGSPITNTTNNGVPVSQAIATAIEKCKNGAQCGKFVNDVLEQVGVGRIVGNDYLSKEKAVDKIGQAFNVSEMGAGSIFAYPTNVEIVIDGKKVKPGHIGIITGVNTDGTINIMDYNYNEDEKQRERLNVNPQEILGKGGAISKPVVSNQTVPETNSKLDTLDFENYVMNFVPQQDRGSDKEKARIISYVKEAMKGGRTAQQAGLAYRGFDIKDPANADKAMDYLDTLNNLPKFPDGGARIISDLVNKGDIAGADRYVSNKVDDAVVAKYGADAIPTSSIQTQEKMINTLRNLIAKNPDKIGAFDGRVTDFVKKFKDQPEMQQLQTTLSMLQANTRKTFAGSNVTPSEMQALQDYVGGTTKMTPNNLLTMLNTVFENTRNEYQSQRAGYGAVGQEQQMQSTQPGAVPSARAQYE